MFGLSPNDQINLMMVALFVFTVVGLFFVQTIMGALIVLVFAIPALIYSAILFVVGYLFYRIVKIVKWIFGSVYRVATVAIVATGVIWAGGYINMTVSMFNRVVGAF